MFTIFINEKYEIKALNESEDTNLLPIEVDREKIFGEMTDFMILNYKYIPHEEGYSICPARDYDQIVMEEKDYIIEQLLKENSYLKQKLSE